MNPTRCMVTAIRIDNYEQVLGFPVFRDDSSTWVIYPDECEVRLDSIEPLAQKVERYDDETLTALCPNCRTLMHKGSEYCKYCGQRLDWNK